MKTELGSVHSINYIYLDPALGWTSLISQRGLISLFALNMSPYYVRMYRALEEVVVYGRLWAIVNQEKGRVEGDYSARYVKSVVYQAASPLLHTFRVCIECL